MAFAQTHNINIQQNAINERVSKLQLDKSRLSVLPSINLSADYGRNFGRSIDPTTNSFISTTYDFTGLGGSAGVLLFGWFGTRNQIKKSDLLYKVAVSDKSQLENDIALNVSTGYLRILLAKDQVEICKRQLYVDVRQITQTEQLLSAGKSNGLDLTQVKVQLSNDSATYFKSLSSLEQAEIDLKAILNIDWEIPFSIAPVPEVNVESKMLNLDRELVYQEALNHMPKIKSAAFNLMAAQKDLPIARSKLYPQLNFSVSSGTNYSSTYQELSLTGEYRTMAWSRQIQNNFSQSVYLGVSIPIFNGLSFHYAVKQAQANIQLRSLDVLDVRLKLKQDVYKAWNDLQTAYQTFKALKSSAALALSGQLFAQKRYEKGLMNAVDLLIAQNNSFQANSALAAGQYDLILRLIIINYYNGFPPATVFSTY